MSWCGFLEPWQSPPHQRGAWIRRMPSSHDLNTKRFGKWLVTYWPDDPVCELRIVGVEKVYA